MGKKKIYKFTGFDRVIFNGVELNQVPPTLEACRWDEIQDLVKSGTLGNYFSLDSRKTIKLSSGEEIAMRLVSINDGTGENGRYYPAGTADFVSYNATSNNENLSAWSKYSNSTESWRDSEVRKKLQSIYNKLPEELKAIITEKEHVYTRSWIEDLPYTQTIKTENIICYDKLWLPTAAEFNGGTYGTDLPKYNKAYTPLQSNRSNYFFKCATSSEEAMSFYSSGQHVYTGCNVVINNDGSIGGGNYNNDFKKPVIIGFRIG